MRPSGTGLEPHRYCSGSGGPDEEDGGDVIISDVNKNKGINISFTELEETWNSSVFILPAELNCGWFL